MTVRRATTGGAVLRPRVTEAIVSATFAELAACGYARLSMEAVARRAGVGKAALYRRWSSKQEMLADLVRQAVADTLPPAPSTGAFRSDLRELLGELRDQVAAPVVADVVPTLLAELRHTPALAEVMRADVAGPRREVGVEMLRAAVERGDLPPSVDVDLAVDLLIAPLLFRVLVTGAACDDAYLDTLTAAVEAAVRATA
ncbi:MULTISPECIES: TetR/AcrR family transcriptional regulator [Pseudonocardia]|uniref:TetR/AcrR family transcriptional regulator n=1 Tax=Pseudonocardia TaxID=1847 RepID=UPI001AD67598|nr:MULTISPECIES: TetR/AcrR family transcriptional regulator [Pseudonocardia]MBO4237808.1 TetR family transcriptional regulator [Pseudonocardia alni]